MTWKELKDRMDAEGVTDDMVFEMDYEGDIELARVQKDETSVFVGY